MLRNVCSEASGARIRVDIFTPNSLRKEHSEFDELVRDGRVFRNFDGGVQLRIGHQHVVSAGGLIFRASSGDKPDQVCALGEAAFWLRMEAHNRVATRFEICLHKVGIWNRIKLWHGFWFIFYAADRYADECATMRTRHGGREYVSPLCIRDFL